MLREQIASPTAPETLNTELMSLSPENCLIQNKEFSVYIAGSWEIPLILNEIFRLRELTFREVGEGTGKSIDSDAFDEDYYHLFLWDHSRSAVAGAYRLALTDRIVEKKGIEGLYSHTLFRFKSGFLENLNGKAIELGRSFICLEYQKKFSSLLLLWNGIGRYIARHPQYRILFGPVSISRSYHAISKSLIVQFLKQNRMHPQLSRFVNPVKPFKCEKVRGLDEHVMKNDLIDMNDISVLVSEIESDGKGMPVLLQHYLKLNAQLMGFNVDPAFSDVVDGLIWVDLTKTDAKLLNRFMGKNGYRIFCEVHEIANEHADEKNPC